LDQLAADAQRKSDERAARWVQRQHEKVASGRLTFLDRYAAHAQRKSDKRAARWVQRQHEKVASGRLTFLDRYAARAQRKGDEAEARWRRWQREVEPVRRLLASGPVKGPSGSTAAIYVDATGDFLSRRRLTKEGKLAATGGSHATAFSGVFGVVYMLLVLAIWLAFRCTFTVHVHTSGSRSNIHVRLPSESAAYRAAGELVPRFQAEGDAALEGWRADVMAAHPGKSRRAAR
jgi:hypothetical protein